jgi:hypothetical protein
MDPRSWSAEKRDRAARTFMTQAVLVRRKHWGLSTVSWVECLRFTMATRALFLALPIGPELRGDTLAGCRL